MATSQASVDWPLHKVRPRFVGVADDQDHSRAVVVLTGAFSPCFSGHVEMIAQARRRLEQGGHIFLGGFLSPFEEMSLKEKHDSRSFPMLSAAMRLRMAELACENVEDLCVSPWQASQKERVSPSDVLNSLRLALKKEFGDDGLAIKLFIVCGSSNQKMCLWVPGCSLQGLVIVPQNDDDELLLENPLKKLYVTEPVAEMKALSSQKLMAKLKLGDTGYVKRLLGPSGRLLLEPTPEERQLYLNDFAAFAEATRCSAGTPLEKFAKRIDSIVTHPGNDDKVLAALVVDGALAPTHRGHVRMVRLAKERLERSGHVVVGAFLAPWQRREGHSVSSMQEASQAKKLRIQQEQALRLSDDFRRHVAKLSVCGDDFLDVCGPEISGSSPLEIVQALERDLSHRFCGSLEGRTFRVFYACGPEVAESWRLNKASSALDPNQRQGVVVVPRKSADDDDDDAIMEDTRHLIFRADGDSSDVAPQAAGLGTRKLLGHISRGERADASRAMAPAAARFLLAPTTQEWAQYRADFDILGIPSPANVCPQSVEALQGKLKDLFRQTTKASGNALQAGELRNILVALDPSWSPEELDSIIASSRGGSQEGAVGLDDFVDWVFKTAAVAS
eukprot:TRINITY_DN4977_c1_g1_i1.p1 TRINITY_DN4977_c1_g1~~TRINITY_DN4977_c1_g1_i1.p1  ORF type:complete len:681 (-),score=141.44 TRINITY_DN4977_c1_g1_i1:83-1933(-)